MTILTAILGIGFLIFVHELGHYLACRLTRTRTETFSVGFGPRLFGWERRPAGSAVRAPRAASRGARGSSTPPSARWTSASPRSRSAGT
jgi:hypothetical protein